MSKDAIKKSLAGTLFNQKAVEPENVLEQQVVQSAPDEEIKTKQPLGPPKQTTSKTKVKPRAKAKKTVKKATDVPTTRGAGKSAPAKKADSVQDVATKDRKVPFSFFIPESLHARLSYYVENHAVGRGSSSIAKIIVAGTLQYMEELEKKAGIKQ